jgi:hypothetical protein
MYWFICNETVRWFLPKTISKIVTSIEYFPKLSVSIKENLMYFPSKRNKKGAAACVHLCLPPLQPFKKFTNFDETLYECNVFREQASTIFVTNYTICDTQNLDWKRHEWPLISESKRLCCNTCLESRHSLKVIGLYAVKQRTGRGSIAWALDFVTMTCELLGLCMSDLVRRYKHFQGLCAKYVLRVNENFAPPLFCISQV